jgi:hypothetical protein
MKFHDVCEFDGKRDEFVKFESEMLRLPGFDMFQDKISFVDNPDDCSSFKIESELPEQVYSSLDTFVENRTSFFEILKYVLAIATINKVKVFYGFAIRALLVVPEGVDVNKLSPEEIDKLDRKPVFVMHGKTEVTVEDTHMEIVDKQ